MYCKKIRKGKEKENERKNRKEKGKERRKERKKERTGPQKSLSWGNVERVNLFKLKRKKKIKKLIKITIASKVEEKGSHVL